MKLVLLLVLLKVCHGKLLQSVNNPTLYLATDGATIYLSPAEHTIKIKHRKVYIRKGSEYYTIGVEPDETKIFVKREREPVYSTRSIITTQEVYKPAPGRNSSPPAYKEIHYIPYDRQETPEARTEHHYHIGLSQSISTPKDEPPKPPYSPRPEYYSERPERMPYPEDPPRDSRRPPPYKTDPPPHREERPPYREESPPYRKSDYPPYNYPPYPRPYRELPPRQEEPAYNDKPPFRYDPLYNPYTEPVNPIFSLPTDQQTIPYYRPSSRKKREDFSHEKEVESDSGINISPFDVIIEEEGSKIVHLKREGNDHCLNYFNNAFSFRPCADTTNIIRFRVLERDSTPVIQQDPIPIVKVLPSVQKTPYYEWPGSFPNDNPLPKGIESTPIRSRVLDNTSLSRSVSRSILPPKRRIYKRSISLAPIPDEDVFSTDIKGTSDDVEIRERVTYADKTIVSPREKHKLDLGKMSMPNYARHADAMYNNIKNSLYSMGSMIHAADLLKVPKSRKKYKSRVVRHQIDDRSILEKDDEEEGTEEEQIEKEILKWSRGRDRRNSSLKDTYNNLKMKGKNLKKQRYKINQKKERNRNREKDSNSTDAESESSISFIPSHDERDDKEIREKRHKIILDNHHSMHNNHEKHHAAESDWSDFKSHEHHEAPKHVEIHHLAPSVVHITPHPPHIPVANLHHITKSTIHPISDPFAIHSPSTPKLSPFLNMPEPNNEVHLHTEIVPTVHEIHPAPIPVVHDIPVAQPTITMDPVLLSPTPAPSLPLQILPPTPMATIPVVTPSISSSNSVSDILSSYLNPIQSNLIDSKMSSLGTDKSLMPSSMFKAPEIHAPAAPAKPLNPAKLNSPVRPTPTPAIESSKKSNNSLNSSFASNLLKNSPFNIDSNLIGNDLLGGNSFGMSKKNSPSPSSTPAGLTPPPKTSTPFGAFNTPLSPAPSLNSMSNLNNLPGMNSLPSMDNLNSMNSLTGMDNLNGMGGMNSMNNISGTSSMNNMSGMNSMNILPNANNTSSNSFGMNSSNLPGTPSPLTATGGDNAPISPSNPFAANSTLNPFGNSFNDSISKSITKSLSNNSTIESAALGNPEDNSMLYAKNILDIAPGSGTDTSSIDLLKDKLKNIFGDDTDKDDNVTLNGIPVGDSLSNKNMFSNKSAQPASLNGSANSALNTQNSKPSAYENILNLLS
ncbi:uncharacterized protein NESG_02296 [Nematocida ausubeli]|uniref:Uncharacterized protein n=1 Tax=Nematocida ausubeli (strain ATCC PRA-371 / ERTm2) TaxID=1913371 RepID=A0A086J052_NEMA1|nr:uncharacterized protein NESG_02296 [Nematocida ausubeli]KFG25520.1 hypothetical protein NESG_02296 [Nematocida ausubeli]